jgi:glycosyltransferase involved in cell wall biosynthesis
MKIGISLFQFFPGKIGGSEEHIIQLITLLPSMLDSSDQVYILGCRENLSVFLKQEHPKLILCEVAIRPLAINLLRLFDLLIPNFFSTYLGKSINALELDVVLFPQQSIFPHGINTKKIITVVDFLHDYFPQNFSQLDRWIRQKKELYIFSNSDGIIANSKTTKKDCCHKFNFPENKCRVIYLGGVNKSVENVAAYSGIQKPYILYPAHSYPHKNHILLIHAFVRFKRKYPQSPSKLILTGKVTSRRLKSVLKDHEVSQFVQHLGYVSKMELYALLQHCNALFYPSLFEGFGIPILEGISMEKPVFCSDLPVFREIVGDAVNYFDPNRIDSIIRQFERIFINQDLSIDKDKYQKIVQQINWQICADQTLKFLKNSVG